MARLGGIRKKIYEGQFNKHLARELDVILYQEELIWFQKSRAKWLNDGDRDSKFYHIKTINRHRRNIILMLRNVDRDWVEEVAELKAILNNFYQDLFTKNVVDGPWCQSQISFPKLDQAVLDSLGHEFNEDEIKCALFSMDAWKAPGPDGFPAGFYQGVWSSVTRNFFDFAKEVWLHPELVSI